MCSELNQVSSLSSSKYLLSMLEQYCYFGYFMHKADIPFVLNPEPSPRLYEGTCLAPLFFARRKPL